MADRDRAIALLEQSVTTYAVTADWLARDGDLANLHGHPRFADLVASLRAKEKSLEDAKPGPPPPVPGENGDERR